MMNKLIVCLYANEVKKNMALLKVWRRTEEAKVDGIYAGGDTAWVETRMNTVKGDTVEFHSIDTPRWVMHH